MLVKKAVRIKFENNLKLSIPFAFLLLVIQQHCKIKQYSLRRIPQKDS